MKRTFFGGVLILTLTLMTAGCTQDKKDINEQRMDGEDASRLASTVIMSDPLLAPQLLSGFYGIEGNAWRWTAKKFSVNLRTPPQALQNGATLKLALTVPNGVIEKLQSVTLSAMADGRALAPETYTKPDRYTYQRDVPAEALRQESLRVDFSLDKAIPPTGADLRELGVLASRVSLETK
jgi:hypothetical protein